jgi:lipoprotein-anchoring transpeptidase ErfK/SrfK
MQNASKAGKDPGGLIKIHGLKNGLAWIGRAHLLFDWTAGCIAMTNEEIDELYDALLVGTAVEIRP